MPFFAALANGVVLLVYLYLSFLTLLLVAYLRVGVPILWESSFSSLRYHEGENLDGLTGKRTNRVSSSMQVSILSHSKTDDSQSQESFRREIRWTEQAV